MSEPKTSYVDWIDTERKRQKLMDIIRYTGLPFAAHLKRNNRTAEQNARLWPLIRPIAKALPEYQGKKMNENKWKQVFVGSMHHAMGNPIETVQTVDGDALITLTGSSTLTIPEFTFLMDLIEAFAAKHGIDVSEPEKKRVA